VREFLVAYDYDIERGWGSWGGLWAIVRAASAEEITDRYPEVVVLSEPPFWMEAARLAQLRADPLRVDLAEDQGIFRAVVAERSNNYLNENADLEDPVEGRGDRPAALRPGGPLRLLMIVAAVGVVVAGALAVKALVSGGNRDATTITSPTAPGPRPTLAGGLHLEVSADGCVDVVPHLDGDSASAPVCARSFQTGKIVYGVMLDSRSDYAVLLIPSGTLLPSSDYSIIESRGAFTIITPAATNRTLLIARGSEVIRCRPTGVFDFEC
jgi:hypothetical protein